MKTIANITIQTALSTPILRPIANVLVDLAKADSGASKIGYYGIPGVGFNCGPLSTIITKTGLIQSLKTQHTTDYWAYLKVSAFVKAVIAAAGYPESIEEIDSGKAAEEVELHGPAADLKGSVSTVQQVEVVDL
ncbi:hypothetical protein MN608_10111 [Microdochium nivale]|nr:hypothetical protein MN608_10111 [Microdochium nivale]